jgi:hypothetical protein
MSQFTLVDSGNVDALRLQLHKDGFQLVSTNEDGSEVYNLVHPPVEKPWTAIDQYKETKARISRQYHYGITGAMKTNRGSYLTDWLAS